MRVRVGDRVTGEVKTKKTKKGPKQYIYYQCAKYNRPGHPRVRLREAQLDEQMLLDLRGLLHEDVAVAAPIIQELTGPITVYQQPVPGKKRPAWHAEFTVNLILAMVILAAQKEYPTSGTWEHLSSTGWTLPEQKIEFRIEPPPSYEKRAQKFRALHDKGQTIILIARAHKKSRNYVSWLIRYSKTGQKPG